MTIDERLDRLTGVVETLAGTVAAHDSILSAHDSIIQALARTASEQSINMESLARTASAQNLNIEAHDRQIGALIELAEKNRAEMADLDRRWQAYLNTLRRQ